MPLPMPPVAILAGGLATRLRPVTEKIPKALIAVAGQPFVAHQLRLLHREGISRVVLCVEHLGEQVREYVGDGKGSASRCPTVSTAIASSAPAGRSSAPCPCSGP